MFLPLADSSAKRKEEFKSSCVVSLFIAFFFTQLRITEPCCAQTPAYGQPRQWVASASGCRALLALRHWCVPFSPGEKQCTYQRQQLFLNLD